MDSLPICYCSSVDVTVLVDECSRSLHIDKVPDEWVVESAPSERLLSTLRYKWALLGQGNRKQQKWRVFGNLSQKE